MTAVINDRFTELSAKAAATHERDALQAFWSALFDEREWHFMPTRVDPAAVGEGKPHRAGIRAVKLGEQTMIPIFTSERRAQVAIQDNNLSRVGEYLAVISMSCEEAVVMISRTNPEQIGFVVINYNTGEEGITVPVTHLALLYEYHHDRESLSPPMWDAFVHSVRRSGATQAWGRLNRRLMHLPAWYTLRQPDGRLVTVQDKDDIVVLAFTSKTHAETGNVALREQGAPEMRGLESTPTEAAEVFGQLREQSGNKLTKVAFNFHTSSTLYRIEDLQKMAALAQREAASEVTPNADDQNAGGGASA